MNAPERASGRWWRPGSHFMWAASLFLTALGTKFALILAKGFPLPYHDQWPAEAVEMFIPYLSGKFTLATLFEPHNEHWIIFTRMLDLMLFRLNGQWDSLLEMTCNAVIHCAGMAAFGWLMAVLLGRRSWLVIWPVLVLALAPPFAWENTLWGYQSQFYFLQTFSWLAIWLLATHQPWSARWWLGAASALAADFTMAPGMLASATVVALTVLAAMKERNWRRQAPIWVVCAMTIGLGILLKESLAVDDVDKAHTAGDLLAALGKSMAWPWVTLPWYAPFNLLPVLLLAWVCFRSTETLKPGEWVILGLAIWTGLQALAAAYARGNGGPGPAWRYLDSLSFIGISGALAAWVLLKQRRPSPRMFPWLGILLACWAVGALAGLAVLTNRAWTVAIPDNVAEHAAQLKASRAWVATGDPRVFLAQPKDMKIAPLAAQMMTNPHIRAVLPACVREPLTVTESTNIGNAFARSGGTNSDPDVKWSSETAREWGTFESEPVKPSSLPYLQIPVQGDLGAEGLSLELVDLKSGAVTGVKPASPPGEEWVNVDMPAPSGEFKILAKDKNGSGWFAFQQPRELGRWSFWTLKLLGCWKCLVVAGLAGWLVNLVGTLREA
jgi:hypothetical protein